MPVQRRTGLGDYLTHGEVASGRPCGYSCYLPIKVLALVSRGHTSVDDTHRGGHGAGGRSMRISPPTRR